MKRFKRKRREDAEEPAVTEEAVVEEEPVVGDEPAVAEVPSVGDEPAVAEVPVVGDEPAVADVPEVADEAGPSSSVDVYEDLGSLIRKRGRGEIITNDQKIQFYRATWKPPPGFKWPTEVRQTKGSTTKYSLRESVFQKYKWLTYSESQCGLLCKEWFYH